jgi:hypothetical protein
MAGTYTYQDGLDEGKAEVDEVLAAAVRAVWGGTWGFDSDDKARWCRGLCVSAAVGEKVWHAPACPLLAAARVLGLEGATE